MIYQFEIFRYLTFEERKTFKYHLAYSILDGITLGVLALNEFVFIKSMRGSEYLLSTLFSFSVIVLIFSVFFNEFLKRIKNKQKVFIYTGLITRTPLLLLFFFPELSAYTAPNGYIYHIVFLVIFFIFHSAQPVVLPLINLFLKSNYEHHNFGKLFSYSTMINKIVLLLATFFFGLLLDYDNFSFRYVYPFLGILGIFSMYLLSRIKFVTMEEDFPAIGFFRSLKMSYNELTSILKQNKAFRDFQTGFMFYGFAFMSSMVLITLFYEKVLHLNYSSVAFYKNFYNIIAIVLLPVFGKLLGRIPLKKFSILTFAFMFMTILLTMLTQHFPFYLEILGIKLFLFLLVANIFYGFFAAAMPLLWGIGSAYFCKSEEVATYQSIHLTMTGLRGSIVPFLGVLIYQNTGFTFTFFIGLISLIIAILVMSYSR